MEENLLIFFFTCVRDFRFSALCSCLRS